MALEIGGIVPKSTTPPACNICDDFVFASKHSNIIVPTNWVLDSKQFHRCGWIYISNYQTQVGEAPVRKIDGNSIENDVMTHFLQNSQRPKNSWVQPVKKQDLQFSWQSYPTKSWFGTPRKEWQYNQTEKFTSTKYEKRVVPEEDFRTEIGTGRRDFAGRNQRL